MDAQAGLQQLRRAFPLQQRIEALVPAERAAYIAILSHWAYAGYGCVATAIPEATLKALVAIDAIVIDGHGVSCYPFSARASGIEVTLGDRHVYAMCAMDALAIPALMGLAGQITADCTACGRPLNVSVDALGGVTHVDTSVEVAWRYRRANHSCCGDSLCPDIRFVCRSCTTSPDTLRFTLADAAIIGDLFFAFQRDLLAASPAPP